MLTQSCKRHFSQTKNLKKYALNKHMKTVGQGQRMMKDNKFIDGVNELTTDYTKPVRTKEIEPLKPIQHPRNIYSDDSMIVSHKFPPKNLTPYARIPQEAMTQINMLCKESPLGARTL